MELLKFARFRTGFAKDDTAITELLGEQGDAFASRLNGIVRVLELGPQIIATCALALPGGSFNLSWLPKTCYVRHFGVRKSFCSTTLLKRVLADAIQVARHLHAEHVCAHVREGTDHLARLYAEFGFRRDEAGDIRSGCGRPMLAYRLKI